MLNKYFTKQINIVLITILAITALIAGCSEDNKVEAVKNPKNIVTQKEDNLSGARNTPIVAAAKKVGPAVVGITNKAYVRDIFNRVQLTERGTGSGVIYDKSGLIATNNHVVEGASEIIVSLTDGRSVKGKVLGADVATDLAVVKITEENLSVAEFGDSSTLQVGEPAIAIGNPLGLELRGSVTAGVVSALNRSIQLGERKFDLIQTDAAINPGNSGGALVNAEGEVVGINSAKIAVSGVEGIGFAIPINAAKPILDELATKGHVVRPYIGASMIDKDIANRYGFDIDIQDGIFVMKVLSGGPADEAGIRPGDIILQFNGEKMHKVIELRSKVSELKVGDRVEVVVLRGGTELSLFVNLKEVPEESR